MKDVLKSGLLDAQLQREEMGAFLVMTQRFAELLYLDCSMEQICQGLVHIIIEESGFENSSIVLWNDKRGCLFLAAAFGIEDLLGGERRPRYQRELSFTTDEGIAGRVFTTQKPVFIGDAFQDLLPAKQNAIIEPIALACLPILDIGVLNISSGQPHTFTPEQKRSWELLSRIVGYMILGAESTDAPRSGLTGRPPILDVASGGELPASGQLIEQALHHTPQGICILDPEARILRVNHSVERLQGRSSVELIGRSPAVLFQDPQIFGALLAKLADAAQEELTDVSLVNAKGTVYPADVSLVRLADTEGGLSGYLLVFSDVSGKKAYTDKILQKEKLAALGTMAGGVAHDFNNLLMAILGNIQLVLPQLADEDVRRRLENVEKAVFDGSHTVRRLQKFTERDREQSASGASVNVSDAIKDIVELTRPRWKNALERQGHTIDFVMELEAACIAAFHASDLREVLTNLLFNAIEAMPEGGTITLRSRADGENVTIEVADTGIGMSDALCQKIFDPFYTTKGIGNSGLGLSVCWSLISRGGGDIQVRSKPGKGSVFTIRLPRAEVPLVTDGAGDASRERRSRRLLLIDDDITILGILRDMLRLKGHRVVATHDAQMAMELIGREQFDLVLTDLGMPAVSGWDIAKEVKAKNNQVPVVLITGWGAQYEDEDVSERGVDMVLSKPVSWEKLVGTIDRLMR